MKTLFIINTLYYIENKALAEMAFSAVYIMLSNNSYSFNYPSLFLIPLLMKTKQLSQRQTCLIYLLNLVMFT